jgi:hypothetical protein
VDRGQTAELTYKPPTNLPDYSRADDAEPSVLEDIFHIGRINKGKDQAYRVTHGDDLEATEGAHMGDRGRGGGGDKGARGLLDTATAAENPLHSGSNQTKGTTQQPQPRWLEEGESKSDKLLGTSSSSSSSVGYASSSGALAGSGGIPTRSSGILKSGTPTPPPSDLSPSSGASRDGRHGKTAATSGSATTSASATAATAASAAASSVPLTPSPLVGGLLDVGDEDENRDDDDEEVDPDRDQSVKSTASVTSSVPLRDTAGDVSLHGDVGKIIEDDD